MATPQSTTVASWPGPGSGTEYIERFSGSLIVAGMTVISVDRPWQCLTKKLDIFHIHWPEQTFWGTGRLIGSLRAIAAVAAIAWLKLRGVKIVWCVQNLEPHDGGFYALMFWRFYSAAIARLVHGFVTLSPSTVEIARARFAGLRKKPAIFVWHPAYLVSHDLRQAIEWRIRRQIGPAIQLIAFVGHVRPYKGAEELVAAFRATNNSSSRLVIAGKIVDQNLRLQLERSANEDTRFILDFRLLSNFELWQITMAANVVVLPLL